MLCFNSKHLSGNDVFLISPSPECITQIVFPPRCGALEKFTLYLINSDAQQIIFQRSSQNAKETIAISKQELLEKANKIIQEHDDFLEGMQADDVEQKSGVLVLKVNTFRRPGTADTQKCGRL